MICMRAQSLSKRAEARGRQIRKQLLKIPVIKRADNLRSDIAKQVEANVESFLGLLTVASQRDIKKLDRKLNQISRKLKALEKAQGNATNS